MKIEKVDHFPGRVFNSKYAEVYQALDDMEIGETIRVRNNGFKSQGFRTAIRTHSIRHGYNCSIHIADDGWIYVMKKASK